MTTYSAKDIDVLEGLEPVRARPGMYIGATDSFGLFQIAKEIIDNSLDECTGGHASAVRVELGENNSFTVTDNGRGIPVEKHPKAKKSTLEVILTTLHAGGKLRKDNSAYGKGSRGCFTGDTCIKLLNGKSVSIEKLYKRWTKKAKPFYVFSFDQKGETSFVPRKCTEVHLTMKTKHLVEVTLDSGEKVRCTPDHPFLTFDGTYVEAQNLEKGVRLRALYLAPDSDGYILHNSRNPRPTTRTGNNDYRVHRTVMASLGYDIDEKHVHHVNGVKTDNRPRNLEVIADRSEHFWKDYNDNQRHQVWVHKNDELKAVSSKNARRLNRRNRAGKLDITPMQGRVIQCAARAVRDHGELTPASFQSCRGWCYPTAATVENYYDWDTLDSLARSYLEKYGTRGKIVNGGNGLDYQLLSEYERSPADNYANHFVERVRKIKLKKAVPVYDLTVEGEHNYLLDVGVFVHNTHGVGAAVTNALCTKMQAWAFRDGKWHTQTYHRGTPVAAVAPAKGKPPSAPKRGTVISCTPDTKIFGKHQMPVKQVRELMRLSAFFVPGAKLTLVHDDKEETFHEPLGVKALLKSQVEASGSEPLAQAQFHADTDGVKVALQWCRSEEESFASYVCGSHTKDGGTHEAGFIKALKEALDPHKGKNVYRVEDLRVGMCGVLNVDLQSPHFEGQTKHKLSTQEATKQVYDAIAADLKKFFRDNKTLTKELIARAAAIREAVTQFNVDKKAAAETATTGRNKAKPPKTLLTAKTSDPKRREIYLVEGGSAGGSAKKARDQDYQEVLMLKGKPINAYKAPPNKVLGNEVVKDILKSLGIDLTLKDPLTNCRTERIILLPDADEDGNHITVLILSLLHKIAPRLFDLNRVFIIDADLFNVWHKGKRIFGESLKDLLEKCPDADRKRIQRVKGWGEINADALREIAFNPGSRRLRRIIAVDKKGTKRFVAVVGDDTSVRRELLGLDAA